MEPAGDRGVQAEYPGTAMRVREAIDFRGLLHDAPRETLKLSCSASAEPIGAILGTPRLTQC